MQKSSTIKTRILRTENENLNWQWRQITLRERERELEIPKQYKDTEEK